MALAKTARDIGLIIRSRRKALGWDQARLAKSAGVSRQWLIDAEKGKPRAELRLILQTMNTLGLTLNVSSSQIAEEDQEPHSVSSNSRAQTVSTPTGNRTGTAAKPANGLSEEMEQALNAATGTIPTAAVEAQALATLGLTDLDRHLASGNHDDLNELMRQQHGANKMAAMTGLSGEMEQAMNAAKGTIPGVTEEAQRLATLEFDNTSKHISSGIPNDLHELMRLHHCADELAALANGLPDDGMDAAIRSATESLDEGDRLLNAADPLGTHLARIFHKLHAPSLVP